MERGLSCSVSTDGIRHILINNEWWPDEPHDNDEHILTREQWEGCLQALADRKQLLAAYERLETEASRDPKAPTWGLALLYPASVFLLWVGLSPPGPEICTFAQHLLITIGGIWTTWAGIRIFSRDRHKYLGWFHYVLMVPVVLGCIASLWGIALLGGHSD
jgi:hypothetical protein